MSATRTRLAAATVALIAAAPLAVLGTANAEQVASQGKAERAISIKGVEPREGVFFVKGKVQPDYEKRFAILQRKLKSANKWSNNGKFKTSSTSRYRERVHALNRPGTVCYRIKIKGNDNFKTSYSGRVCIRTFRA